MSRGTALAAFAAVFVLVTPAHAAVVVSAGGTATYLALPGERNDLTVTQDGADAVFADRGGLVSVAGPGCSASSGRTIRCAGVQAVHVDLLDGDDRLVVAAPLRVRAFGGPGDDVLIGGPAADELDGGPGNDLIDGGPGADRLSGGPGTDTADYSSRSARVVVTLDGHANDGERGEHDNVVGIEKVLGGAGPDVLVGDSGPNVLEGGSGNDALAGGGGNDVLEGGPGEDGINANDPVATADSVGCGAQRDRVFGDARDTIQSDCEWVDRSGTFGYARVADAGPGPPVLGKSVVVKPVSGVVLVAPPDPHNPAAHQPVPASSPVPLDGERNIPVGSVVDTRLGTVQMTTAIDHRGTTQTGRFRAGSFQVFQRDADGAPAELALRGGKSFASCRSSGGRGARRQARTAMARSAAGRRRRVVRRLWSSAHGKFRTSGRFASATVRGTRWLTADRCDGTLVRVLRGQVSVHDVRLGRDVLVSAGESYLARSPSRA